MISFHVHESEALNFRFQDSITWSRIERQTLAKCEKNSSQQKNYKYDSRSEMIRKTVRQSQTKQGQIPPRYLQYIAV